MGNAPSNAPASKTAKEPTTKGKFKRGFCLIPDRPDIYSSHKRYDKFRNLPKATHPVNAVAVAETALILAAATLGTTDEVHMWDLLTKELKVSLHAHSAHVWDLEFSPNETTLATASNDHTVRLWDTYTGQALGVLSCHTAGVRTLSFTTILTGSEPQGYLITGGCDSLLCLWEYGNEEPIQKWQAHEGDVHGVKFSAVDAGMAFSVGADGSVALWDVMHGEDGLVTRFPGGEGKGVLCVAGHPKRRDIVAAGNQDGGVWLWHFSAGPGDTSRNVGNQLRGHQGPVWGIAFSQDGCLLASGSSDSNVRVWLVTNLSTPILVAVLKDHDSWVRQVHFNKYNWIYSCSVDGRVREWVAPKALRNLQQLDFLESLELGTGETQLPEQIAAGGSQADLGDLGPENFPAEGDVLGDALRAAAQLPEGINTQASGLSAAPVLLTGNQPPPPRHPPPARSWGGPAPPRMPPLGNGGQPQGVRPPPRPPPPGVPTGTLLPPFIPLDHSSSRIPRGPGGSTLLPPVPPVPPPPPSQNPRPP